MMAQLTTEERDLLFLLGYNADNLRKIASNSTRLEDANSELSNLDKALKTLKDEYKRFREEASRFGIELEPDLPHNGTAHQIEQFVSEQIYKVSSHMTRLGCTEAQYALGTCVSVLSYHILVFQEIKRPRNHGEETDENVEERLSTSNDIYQKIDESIKDIRNLAEILDVNKGQLETVLENIKDNALSLDEQDLRRKLQILLCGGKISSERSEVQRSEVEDTPLLKRKWYEKPTYQMMATFILGLVVAIILLKAIQSNG